VHGAILPACAPGRLLGWLAGLARRGAAILVLALPVPGGGQAKVDDLEHHQVERLIPPVV
jgi:hypothetical protein